MAGEHTTTETTQQTQQTAWHTGLDAEIIGHIQNRGLKLDDPKAIVDNLAKAHREASSKLGVPADQLLRMPKADAPEAEIKAFHQRLGAPADPKEYDFTGIKYANGKEIEQPLADALRASFAKRFVPKDTALEIAKDVIKYADSDEAQKLSTKTAAIEVEKAQLKSEWKQDYDGNLFIAKRGAQALGMTAEQVTALEGIMGYKGIMTALHKVGVLNKEPNGLIGGGGANNGPMSREQAMARKQDLMKDEGWRNRHYAGDTRAREEMLNLNRIITGDFESAA